MLKKNMQLIKVVQQRRETRFLFQTWFILNGAGEGVACNSPWAEGSWSDNPKGVTFSSSINAPDDIWRGPAYYAPRETYSKKYL